MCLRFFNALANLYARLLGYRYSAPLGDARVLYVWRNPWPGMAAMTIGERIISTYKLNPAMPFAKHELEHVRQWRKWRCLFPVLYLLASLYALITTGRPYYDNYFERKARETEDE